MISTSANQGAVAQFDISGSVYSGIIEPADIID